jgi:DNA replication protein DnaC
LRHSARRRCDVHQLRTARYNLNAARATGAYERKLATLARVPLLIIDDFGLKPRRPPQDEDLHDLIAERYERASTIVTSNLDFTEWDQAFPNNRLLASRTQKTADEVDDHEKPSLPRLSFAKASQRKPSKPVSFSTE